MGLPEEESVLNQAPNSMTADGHFCAPALLGRRLIASLEATERLDGWLAYKGRPTPQPEPAKAPAPKKDASNNPPPEAPKPAEPAKESK